MGRSLTARIAWSHIALAVSVNVFLLILLQYGLTQSFEQGTDAVLLDLARSSATDQGVTPEDVKNLGSESVGGNSYVRVLGRDAEVMSESGWDGLTGHPELVAAFTRARSGETFTQTLTLEDGRKVRLVTRKLLDGSGIQGGFLIEGDPELQARLLQYGLGGVLALSVFAAAVGWLAARSAMQGVKDVTRTAQRIVEGSSDARVPGTESVAEVTELSATFNQMLDRIDALVSDVRDVTTTVAHDLRSPLARIRSQAEVSLRGDQSIGAYRAASEQILEDTILLDGLLATMLEVASLDAGRSAIRKEPLDLLEVVADTSELFRDAAEAQGRSLELVPGQPVEITADEQVLQRTFSNLFDNALKFTPEGGTVRVGVSVNDGFATVSVSDSGPGIDPAEIHRVTERFYRGDAARSVPGQGLGLTYVESAAEAHGGTLTVGNSDLGGAQIDVALPLPSSST